jgi:hypothetical protein
VRNRMTGVIVAGVLMIAGAAVAQTARPSVEPSSRGIIPVTGPSMVPALPEPAKPEVVPAVVQGEVANPEGARKSMSGRRPVSTAARPAPGSVKAVKAVQKPVAKTTVKKTSAAKHVAKAPGPQKTKHVAAVKHQPTAHHATVGKPIPVTKHQPPAKGAAPAQPVLPRV